MAPESVFWTYAGPFIMAGFTGVCGFGLLAMWRRIAALEKELHALEDKIPDLYVRRAELNRIEDRIVSEIRKLDDGLEHHMEVSVARWQNTLLQQQRKE